MKARGIVIGFLLLWVLLLLVGCAAGGGSGLFVGGIVTKNDQGGTAVVVGVLKGSPTGPGVGGATVTINGTPIAEEQEGLYSELTGPAIADGSEVVLEVQQETEVVSATLLMPEKPAITNPIDGESVGNPVTAIWTIGSSPDSFQVTVLSGDTISGMTYNAELPGIARSHTMDGIFNTASESSEFTVLALNTTTLFSGEAEPNSFFTTGNGSIRSFDPD